MTVTKIFLYLEFQKQNQKIAEQIVHERTILSEINMWHGLKYERMHNSYDKKNLS